MAPSLSSTLMSFWYLNDTIYIPMATLVGFFSGGDSLVFSICIRKLYMNNCAKYKSYFKINKNKLQSTWYRSINHTLYFNSQMLNYIKNCFTKLHVSFWTKCFDDMIDSSIMSPIT